MKLTPRQNIYDAYWYFAYERQNIFYRKLDGSLLPYTHDPILAKYKFCNVYRAADRVSQFLIRSVVYSDTYSNKDTLFRIFLFRLLNKSETWTRLESEIGEITLESFDFDAYDQALTKLRLDGPIYGNAFILCANKAFGYERKHQNHLALLQSVFIDTDVSQKLIDARSLQDLFHILRGLPLIGDFMAYQLAIDFNYSEVFSFSENDFTVTGPGSKRGIAKCFESLGTYTPSEVIMYMVEHQASEFEKRGLDFKKLGSRKLQAIDCQGLFCEVDKYCRIKYPELASNRVRMKSAYAPTHESISYLFPPKWGVILRE